MKLLTDDEISCERLDEFVVDYLDNALPREQRAVFEHHLGICPPCRQYLDQYKDVIAMEQRVINGDLEAALVSDPSGGTRANKRPEMPEPLVQAILKARLTQPH